MWHPERQDLWAHAEVLARLVVDNATGMTAVETRGAGDEVGHVERQEALAVEAAGIALRQHEGLGGNAVGIDMTEVGPRIETVIATGTQHEPARIGAPVVERLCVHGVGLGHRAAFSGREVEKVEVGFVVPNAELAVIGECVAQEAAVVGGTGEGYGLVLGRGIDDGFYMVAEGASSGVEVDAAEVIADGVELMIVLG